MLIKLAIVTTHPIQYNAPWFRRLAERGNIIPKVFYTWSQLESGHKFDPGFAKSIEWDIPLLEGYQFTFVKNVSTNPGSHHRHGIINPSLNNEIENWKPDAVLVFGWNFTSHFKCIRHFSGKIPVLFRGDSTFLRKQPMLKAFLRQLYLKWVYSFIDTALYVGIENKKYFIKCGLKEHQLVFAPHAIDNERFTDKNGNYGISAADWRKKLGIAPNVLTILYAGKLEPIKSPELIVELASRLAEEPVHFVIAGNGPLERKLKDMAKGKNITFIDFQNQQMMPVLYRIADFFMLSSESETWGLGINEAMACGNAIVARNTCGCIPDLVKNGENGFVFDAANMEALLKNLETLINGRDQWERMGHESVKIIATYSFENIVSAVEASLLTQIS